MKEVFRTIGWLLLVFGAVLAGLASQARKGVAPLGIDIFGDSIHNAADGARWMNAGIAAVVVGLVFLFLTRRNWTKVEHH